MRVKSLTFSDESVGVVSIRLEQVASEEVAPTGKVGPKQMYALKHLRNALKDLKKDTQ